MAEAVDQVVDDAEFQEELDKVGSERGKLRRKMADSDPEMARLFNEQTEEQKAWGRLIGKLMLCRSNDEVERAFDWFSVEHNAGAALPPVQRAVAFFHAVASNGCDEAHYRILRRMYIKANTNE